MGYGKANAYAVRLRDGSSVLIKTQKYSSSLVSPLMRMHSGDGYVAVAVCGCITFRSVHVAIEKYTHPILLMLNQAYGIGSQATFKEDCMELYGDCTGIRIITAEFDRSIIGPCNFNFIRMKYRSISCPFFFFKAKLLQTE